MNFTSSDSEQGVTIGRERKRESFAQVAYNIDTDPKTLAQRITAQLEATMATPGLAGKIWIRSLLLVIAAAAVAYAYQLAYGLQVTAMREYISWGVYITNFVFFIGISHAGTLISAILRVTNAEWRRSVTRVAEAITVFALMVGAPMVVIDMGRIDRILHVVYYGRLNSPLLWDVCSICTYLAGSFTFLYVAMIPDLAILAKKGLAWEKPSLFRRFYRAASLGYRGTPQQKHLLERAMHAMSVIIIPVAVSVHTVVSWIFGMTLRPGWHSTIFGPYFVVGAIYSGTAALIVAMAVFRRAYHLENLITMRQFRALGALLMALTVVYLYFTLSEYLTTWYGGEAVDRRLLHVLMGQGPYGITWWAMVAGCFFLPAILLVIPVVFPNKLSLKRLVIASILINIGMWLKRYLIIVPTLMTPFIPAEAAGVTPHYHPTLVEWTITAGAFAVFLLLFTLFAKIFPIVSMWETIEGVEEVGADKIGIDVTPPPDRSAIGRRSHSLTMGLAILFAVLFLGANRVSAVDVQAEKPQPQITIATSTEEGKKVIIVTVTSEGKPVEGSHVVLQIKRTFGNLTLGEEDTLADGTIAVPFPADLPGGPEGKIQVVAQIKSPPELATTATQTLDGASKVLPNKDPFPRALWAPHAPLALLITIGSMLTIVWSVYVFVVVQLIKIRKESIREETSS
ncbi:MAG TPA: NrfD/PsrC family molybdoenzyme membrane anchor subunit [Terriglobales bacterium]|nr:NrfD/PsrC family molybdoenzyme membrane anchor subunit [Terriglobales bacterium]